MGDISEKDYANAIISQIQEAKSIAIDLDQANKDIARKGNIIACLVALIVGTNDIELITKMNEQLKELV